MAGLSSTGFVIKTLPEIVDDLNAGLLTSVSSALDVQPTAIVGVITGIYAQAVYELWQLAGALYTGMDPDQAVGDQLAALALLTGAPREPATATIVQQCVVNVNAGFDGAPGQMVASIDGSPAVQFENLTEVSNQSSGPADFVVDFIATTTGPVQALAGTLTKKAQPLSGWNSITNPTDGIVGKSIESDSLLRTRRQLELTAAGSSTAEAIVADVYASSDAIVFCNVLYNQTDVTDSNGLPPHSIEVIAYQPGATGDDDAALAKVILDSKSAGDGTHGTSHQVVLDSQNNSETIYFTRPTTERLYVAITVKVDPNLFPANGLAQIKSALANYAAEYKNGTTVYSKHLQFEAFTVPGVLDITSFALGIAPSPTTDANVSFTIRQLPQLSTGDVGVTVT